MLGEDRLKTLRVRLNVKLSLIMQARSDSTALGSSGCDRSDNALFVPVYTCFGELDLLRATACVKPGRYVWCSCAAGNA